MILPKIHAFILVFCLQSSIRSMLINTRACMLLGVANHSSFAISQYMYSLFPQKNMKKMLLTGTERNKINDTCAKFKQIQKHLAFRLK